MEGNSARRQAVLDARGMGDDGGMTPEEADRFYEDDEDPEKIFVKFDAAPKGVTASLHSTETSLRRKTTYVIAAGLFGELRRRLLPEVTTRGPSSYMTGRA